MTVAQLNALLNTLSSDNSRESAIAFSKALMQLMGINADEQPRVTGGFSSVLQKMLADNPRVKSQALLYSLNANQNISCRFAVVKKINRTTLFRLCYLENQANSWQANINIPGTDKLPYTIDFITTEKFNAVTVAITQGDQIRTITFKERLTNLQHNKVIPLWQRISEKPKTVINTDLWSSLDLKLVNKDFYIAIKQKYDALIDDIQKQHKSIDEKQQRMFAIHLIGRYLFCWFLKEKGIIHADVLSSTSLRRFKDIYNKITTCLFFDTLNTLPFPERTFPADVPEELIKHLAEIPYLNGGLFEPAEEDKLIKKISLDDWLISFIELLESYNFTVDESSTNYEQVEIDPEMLGRILENLLASLNPETEKIANERNALGAFYTPRPIVDYMVTESLKVFFESQLLEENKAETIDDNFFTTDKTKTDLFSDSQPKQMAIDINKLKEQTESREKLRVRIDKLFDHTAEQNPFTAAETRKLKQALTNCKIIDPACGSGAFPMGVLHKLEMLHEKLGTTDSSYELRRNILSQNIYGVDILPMAVEISRLRAWLALVLVCEYKRPDKKHNFNVKALPNLDFKFMCANALVSVPENEFVDLMAAADLKLFEELTAKYFSSNTDEKAELKEEIQSCIDRITLNHEKTVKQLIVRIEQEEKSGTIPANKLKKYRDNKILFEKQQKQWHSYKNIFSHGTVDFFDAKYFFPAVKNGFDIVIANPPYVRQENILELKPLLEKYKVYVSSADLLVYFYELGCNLLKKNGVLTLITSNKFMRANYGENLRAFLQENISIESLIDFGDLPVFEVLAYPVVMIAQKKKMAGNYFNAVTIESENDLKSFSEIFKEKSISIKQSDLSTSAWRIESSEKSNIQTKLLQNTQTLDEYVEGKHYRGITTGFNDAFVIDLDTRNKLIKEDPKSKNVIKPFLRGRDIKRYQITNPNLFIIVIKCGWTNENRKNKEPEMFFKNHFPSLYKHFINISKIASQKKGKGLFKRDDMGDYWWELRACAFYDEFDKPKIMMQGMMIEASYTIDDSGSYLNAPANFIASSEKYLLGLLNSKLLWWFLYNETISVQQGYARIYLYQIEKLPIRIAENKTKKSIEKLVEKILNAKTASQSDTSKEEKQIDIMVYHLYNLTYEEAKIIDAGLSEEEFEKYKL